MERAESFRALVLFAAPDAELAEVAVARLARAGMEVWTLDDAQPLPPDAAAQLAAAHRVYVLWSRQARASAPLLEVVEAALCRAAELGDAYLVTGVLLEEDALPPELAGQLPVLDAIGDPALQALPSPSNVPPPSVWPLLGRAEALTSLFEMLQPHLELVPGGPGPRVALSGSRANGRSELARHVAWLLRPAFPGGTFLVRGEAPERALATLAPLLGLHDDGDAPPLAARAAFVREALAGRGASLLIVDGIAGELDEWLQALPEAPCRTLLVPDELRGDALERIGLATVVVEPLRLRQGLELIAHVGGLELRGADLDSCKLLANLLGGLPVSLALVARLIGRAGAEAQGGGRSATHSALKPSGLAAELLRLAAADRSESWLPGANATSSTGARLSGFGAVVWVLLALLEHHRAARDLFLTACHLDADDLPLDALFAAGEQLGHEPAAAERALHELLRLGLLAHGGEGRVWMPRSLRQVGLSLVPREQGPGLLHAAIGGIAAVWHGSVLTRHRERPHLERVADQAVSALASRTDETLLWPLRTLALHALEEGESGRAETWAHALYDAAARHHGDRHPETGSALCTMAEVMLQRGAVAEAEGLLRQGLELLDEGHGHWHPDVATGLQRLADLLEHQGLLSEAEGLLQQALEIQQHLEGPESAAATALHLRLANLLHAAGDLDGSIEWLSRGLEMLRASHGDVHAEVATALEALAQLLDEAHDRDGATRGLSEAAGIWAQLPGGADRAALCLLRLGQHWMDARQPGPAEEALREGLELASDAETVAALWGSLGQLLQAAGRREQAEEALRASLEGLERANADAATKSVAYSNLAHLLQQSGRLEQAETLLLRSVEALSRGGAPVQAQLAGALTDLGQLHRRRRQLDAAEACLRQAWELQSQLCGEDDPAVAGGLTELGIVLRERGKLEEARRFFEACLRIRRAQLDPVHPEMAAALHNLALVEKDLGQLDAAEAHLSESIETLHELHGPGHPALAIGLSNLSQIYRARGDLATAAGFLGESLRLLERSAPDDPRTAVVRRNLERLRRKLKETH